MKKIILLLLLAALPSVAHAQGRYFGSANLGVSHLDLSDFNNSLTSNYPSVKDNLFAVGGNGFNIRRRVLFGAEGLAMVSKQGLTGDGRWHTRFSAGYGAFNLGYAAVDRRGWLVYPLIGIGVGGVNYAIDPVNGASWNSVLSNPARASHMMTPSMVVPVRVGIEHHFRAKPARERTRGPHGPTVGAKLGYVFAPLRGGWHIPENVNITDGPATTVAGPQLLISVGGWHVRRR